MDYVARLMQQAGYDVTAWILIRDLLESLHVIPEIGRLDALHELARSVIDPRVALSGRDRTRGWRREKSYSDRSANHHQPRTRSSQPQTLLHETTLSDRLIETVRDQRAL